jgi:aromatic ring-cleaving dioxygenase
MTEIRGYHAHVYYNADTRKNAEGLRDTIANRFGVEPHALSDEPRGPHPIPQFNVIFKVEEFHTIVP